MPSNLLGNSNKVATLAKPTSDSDYTSWWEVDAATLTDGIRSVFELESAFGALSSDEPDVNSDDHYTLARLFMVLEKQVDEIVTKIGAIEGDNPDGNQALFVGKAMGLQTMNSSGKGVIQLHCDTGTSNNEEFQFDFGFGYNGGGTTSKAGQIKVGKVSDFSTSALRSSHMTFSTMYKGITTERIKIDGIGNIALNAKDGVTAGWHGSTERILLLPYMFLPNDDSSYFNRCVVDNGGQIAIKSSSLELYCHFRVPYGYKMTKFKIYGSPSRTINLYTYDIDSNSASGVVITNATLGNASEGVIGSTGVSASDTNYHAFKISTASTGDRIWGGYVTIEPI